MEPAKPLFTASVFLFVLMTGPWGLAASIRRFVVVVPQAVVHQKASFSSPRIEILPQGTILRISSRKAIGPDGVGVFYPVVTPSGKRGYLSDVEVEPAPATAPAVQQSSPAPVAGTPSAGATPSPGSAPAGPFASPQAPVQTVPPVLLPPPPMSSPQAEKSYWGFGIGSLQYGEKYLDQNLHANRMAFSMVWQSAKDLFLGLRPNVQGMLSPGAPHFLVGVGAEGTSGGFLLGADFQLQKRLLKQSLMQPYIGIGAAFIHTQFHTDLIGVPYKSTATRLGGTASLGLFVDRGSWGFTVDLRYYLENAAYPGLQFSFVLLQ